MGSIKVHAGSFLKGDGQFSFGSFSLRTKAHRILGETIPASNLESLEVATEGSVKKIGGTVGWGIAGAALLGPVGLLAGLIAGGRRTQITFVAKFKDGRTLLATADSKVFTQIQSEVFEKRLEPRQERREEIPESKSATGGVMATLLGKTAYEKQCSPTVEAASEEGSPPSEDGPANAPA